jgi:hypothetical protein
MAGVLSEIDAFAASSGVVVVVVVEVVDNLTRCWVALERGLLWDDKLGAENAEACLATRTMRLELATRNPNIM